jgi:hypothetical protein
MGHPREHAKPTHSAELIDFDQVMLDACPPEIKADLLMEAKLLAGVFAPKGDSEALLRVAAQLSSGERDAEMDRAHARRVAAALKRLARKL